MTKLSGILADILRYSIVPFLAIVVIFSAKNSVSSVKNLFDGYGLYMCIFGLMSLILGGFVIKSKFTQKNKLLIVIGISLAVRFLWIKFVPSVPVSDYKTMYDCAGEIILGDFSGMQGISYFSRYPHLILSVIYMAFMRFIFGASAVSAMQYVAVVLSTLNVFLIYKLSYFFAKTQNGRLISALFAALFPPFITYVSTMCTENLALPFLLLSMLYFCKIMDNGFSAKNAILCGLFLGISNMFRGVGAIIFIAMFIFIFLYNSKKRLQSISLVAISMVGIIAFTSTVILASGITQAHIWEGKESSITYFLKGLNVDGNGMWTEEDAIFVEEHFMDENFNEQCINVIKARLSNKTATEVSKFFFDKFVNQWSYGDCNGTFWAFMKTDLTYKYPTDAFSQTFCFILLILSFVSLLKRQNKYETLLHIFMVGFGLFFLVFETQPRYAYIIYWIFIPLSVQGIETLFMLLKAWRNK